MAILSRLRANLNTEYAGFFESEGQDVCKSLYLTERDSCVPDELLSEDLMGDIIRVYCHLFYAVQEEVCERLHPAEEIRVYAEPDYLDRATALLVTPTRVLVVE